MSEEGEIKGRLVLDSSQFRRDVAEARAKLGELTSSKTDVKVTAETREARRNLDDVAKSANAVAVAETRLKAAVQASDRATAVALLAQMRLKDVQEKRGRTALQVASAEEALRFATEKSDNAAAKAVLAERSLESAHRSAAAAALEQAAAEDTVGASIDRVSRRADSGAGRIALWTSAIIAAVPALFPIAGVATAGAVALGGLGVAGLLAGTGVARGLKEGTAAGNLWRPIVKGVTDDIHHLQDTAAIGLLPGAEATFMRLQGLLPEVDRGVAEMAEDLGQILPTGLDAVVTLTERGVPLWRSGADLLGRMVTGLDGFAHSDAYKGFIDYSVRNGPKAEQFLTHTLQLVGDIITAWAPYGEEVLPVLDDTVVTVGQIVKALGPAVPAIAAVYLGFRAWTGVRTVVDGITTGLKLMGVEAAVAGGKVAAAEAAAGGAGVGVGAAAVGSAGVLVGAGYAGYSASQANYANTAKQTKGSPQRKAEVAATAQRASVAGPATAGGGGMDLGLGQMFDQMAAKEKLGAKTTDSYTASQKRASVAVRNTVSAIQSQITALSKANSKLATTANQNQTMESSWDGAADAAKAATDAIKDNGTSLDRTTAKGRANREMILQAIQAANQHAAAINADGKHSGAAAVYTDQFAVSLQNSLVKMGMSKDAAGQYIAKLLGIPKSRSTTAQLKTDTALAKLQALQARIDALHGKSVTITANGNGAVFSDARASYEGHAYGGTAGAGRVLRAATGMTVSGPGTARSDSVKALLSVGEEVTSNVRGQAATNRPMLKAINTGNKALIARTAQQMYGTGQAQTVHVHLTGDDSALLSLVGVQVTQGLAAKQAADERTQRMGWQNRGIRG